MFGVRDYIRIEIAVIYDSVSGIFFFFFSKLYTRMLAIIILHVAYYYFRVGTIRKYA